MWSKRSSFRETIISWSESYRTEMREVGDVQKRRWMKINCESEGEISNVERRWVIMCGRSVCPVWYGQKHLYTIQHYYNWVLPPLAFSFLEHLPLHYYRCWRNQLGELCISVNNPSWSSMVLRTVQLEHLCLVVIWLFSLRHTLKICSSIRDDDCICTRKSTLYRQNTLTLF